MNQLLIMAEEPLKKGEFNEENMSTAEHGQHSAKQCVENPGKQQRNEDKKTLVDIDEKSSSFLHIIDKNDTSMQCINTSGHIFDISRRIPDKFLKKPLIEVINFDEYQTDGDKPKTNEVNSIIEINENSMKSINSVEKIEISFQHNLVDVIDKVESTGDKNAKKQVNKVEETTEQIGDSKKEELIIEEYQNEKVLSFGKRSDYTYYEGSKDETYAKTEDIVTIIDENTAANELFSNLEKLTNNLTFSAQDLQSNSNNIISGVTFYCENLDSLKEAIDNDFN